MSWTDQQSIRVINYLRKKFKINTFIETGSYRGINARLHSKNFKHVLTCENVDEYYNTAKERLKNIKNVEIIKKDSPEFLKRFPAGNYIVYLDAHFYDPKLPYGKGKFIVLKELDNMKKFKNSIIIIHDFDNGLGHINYDGISLDMDLIRCRLKKINRNFFFYTNTLEGCTPLKPIAQDMIDAGLDVDFDTLDNINYAWTSPEKTYRGILYCLTTKLNKEEIKKLGLQKWN